MLVDNSHVESGTTTALHTTATALRYACAPPACLLCARHRAAEDRATRDMQTAGQLLRRSAALCICLALIPRYRHTRWVTTCAHTPLRIAIVLVLFYGGRKANLLELWHYGQAFRMVPPGLA